MSNHKKRKVVFISAFHDYRTPKKASIHQIADGLVRAGFEVSFISTRLSWLSRRKGDSRLFLWNKSNIVEAVNGINCFLWRTALHPFRTKIGVVDAIIGKLFAVYANTPSKTFDKLISPADYVILEAGIPAIYLQRIKRLNPTAKIICYCTDRPDTVGSHPAISRILIKENRLIDHFILRSAAMADYFYFAKDRLYKTGFGIDHAQFSDIGISPYNGSGNTAVSVGSMLFDETFFDIAAQAFPDLQFYVIGSGAEMTPTSNLNIYGEMPFSDTLPFVKHASIGIAPYRPAAGVEYLADSSLKLAQFEYFGIPAVCPHFAVGTSHSRIGYEPDNEQSIKNAISAALAMAGKVEPRKFPDWSEIAMRVLEPTSFTDTALI